MPQLDPISRILFSATPEHPRHSEASVLRLRDGRLLLAWTEFSAGWRDEAAAVINALWSDDRGSTWSSPATVQENIGRLNVMSPSLAQLPSGRILMAFHRKDGQPIDCHQMVKWSDDAGRSWSEPIQITWGRHFWCGTNDRLIRLGSGRILLPVGTDLGLFTFYSDDDGRSWSHSAIPVEIPPAAGYAEPVVVELADGSVLMLIRAYGGYIRYARSRDRALTWEPWDCGESAWLSSPHAPSNCKRVPGREDLLLVWNNNGSRRIPLTAAISPDGARSWKHFRDLEPYRHCPPVNTYAYPSIEFDGDWVHLTYWDTHRVSAESSGAAIEAGHDPQQRHFHLRYRRLPLAWFYDDQR